MAERRELGGWLDRLTGSGPADAPGSGAATGPVVPTAPLGRRVLGIAVDWAFALLIANGLMRGLGWGSFAPLAALLTMHVFLVGTAGYSAGHWIAGLRVTTLQGGPPGPIRALVRSLLLVLVIPAVMWGSDGRGLHDKAAGTAVVRR